MVVMTYICYRGIDLRGIPEGVAVIEIVMLAVFLSRALIRVYAGHAASVSIHRRRRGSTRPHPFVQHVLEGILLMIFILLGLGSAVSVNEETAKKTRRRRAPSLIHRPAAGDLRARHRCRAASRASERKASSRQCRQFR